MFIAHKIEIKPTEEQEPLLRQSCGTARFTYNWALVEWKKQYESGMNPSAMLLKKQFNTIKGERFPWISDVCRDASNTGFENIDKAFKNFFRKTAKFPVFKKKGKRDSFRLANDRFYTEDGMVHLPRIGKARLTEKPRFTGKVICGTVSRTAHKWFISITFEVQDSIFTKCENQAAVGIDLGIKTLAVLSDGKQFEGPKALGSATAKLTKQSRQVSRKIKGSNNWKKAVRSLVRTHYRVGCVRSDSIHKLTHFVTANYRYIAIEDLNVAGMVTNHKLARSLVDQSFGEVRRQLEYKSRLHGNIVATVDRFFPSSKACSFCGWKKEDLPLSDREFVCENCGQVIDRDLNASINIKNYGLNKIGQAMAELTPVDSRSSKAAG